MKAAVTGATGLIGAHILRALRAQGHEVIGVARSPGIAAPGVAWVAADLQQPAPELGRALRGCEVVFHTAAHFAYSGYTPAELHRSAVAGTETVLQACAQAGVGRVVVTSSSVVFGYSTDGSVLDETTPLGDGTNQPPYVTAKLAQHRQALELAAQLGLDVRLACPTMTLGPTGARLGPSNGLILGYLADPFACTWSGGCNLVHARDVAAGHLLIAAAGTAGESYLLGSENLSWRQIHGMIAELAGIAAPRMELTHTLGFLAATAEEARAAMAGRAPLSSREQATMIGRYYWYAHRNAAALGYAPTPARAAMIETLSWLVTTPHVSREVRVSLHLADDVYRFRRTALKGTA